MSWIHYICNSFNFVCLHVGVGMCVWVQASTEAGGAESPGAGVTDAYELPDWCQEWNLGPCSIGYLNNIKWFLTTGLSL